MAPLLRHICGLGVLAILACAVAMPSSAQAHSVAFGAYSPGANNEPAKLDALSREAGRDPAIIHWYRDWNDKLIYTSELANVEDHGAVPLISWEPHGRPLRAIASGSYDAFIRTSARDAAAWGKPILLRFAHEMNGDWYPWGTDGNSARTYKRAWRHIVSVFRSEGADNVRFVWSPNVKDGGEFPFARLFPGDRWVDWVALDGYNFGAEHGSWQSFPEVFRSSYRSLKKLTRKPMMIAEVSSNEAGGNKATWTTRALSCQLPKLFPRIRALVWFDRAYGGVDWRIDSSSAARTAFRRAIGWHQFSLGSEELLAGNWEAPEPRC